MNVQELITYVEELTFKSSIVGGYDKDEVDLQLDKICDEIEKIVKEKDEEIAALKKGAPIDVTAKAEDEKEEEPLETEEFEAEEVSKEEAMESAKEIYERETEQITLQLQALQEENASLREQLEEAQEKLDNLELINADLHKQLDNAPEAVSVPEIPVPAEGSTDEAYRKYVRNADLLCEELQKKKTINKEAQAKADKIVEDAKAKAGKILEDAKAKADADLEKSQAEHAERLQKEQAEFDELKKKKAEAEASLKEMAEKLQSLFGQLK